MLIKSACIPYQPSLNFLLL